jgi:hypothetical protein
MQASVASGLLSRNSGHQISVVWIVHFRFRSVGALIVPPSAVYAVKCKRVRVTDDPRLEPSTIQRVARPTGASLVNLMANAELGVARAYTSCHRL